jgi:HD-GYP domain-containing protein (c-di-GMP phosphodiesterase class II)
VRIAFMAAALGVRLDHSEETIKKIAAAGLLHDVGKLRLGAASRKDPRQMRMHPVLGYKMLEPSIHGDVLRAVLEHHERANGSGYPQGLSLEKIGDISRIIGLANAYDRLLGAGESKESKEGDTPHRALSKLYLQSGTGFPVVEAAAFVRLLGVYPLGSLVRLHDGRCAVVVDVSEETPLRPTLRVAFDARLRPVPSQIITPFELEGEDSPLQIEACLDPRPLRLDTKRFIF